MYALVNHVTIYHCFLSINNIVSHAFSRSTAFQRGVIAVEVNIAGPFKHASIRKRYTVNPPAYTRYLIWKELFTLVVTSCMHTEVAFSVQEEFFFPILRFYTSFTMSPALP